MNTRVSIVVPSLNEEDNLENTINSIFKANEKLNHEINILIINDGSEDSTREIAEELARSNGNIKVHHNRFTRGLGTAFVIGIMLSEGDYYGYIPGDNQITPQYIEKMFAAIGESDLVLSYPENMHVRLGHRRIISKLFTRIYNFLFKLDLRYYNGPALFRLDLLREIDLPTRFFSYHAETVIRFIKCGYSYVEVGGKLSERKHGKSTALKWFNFIGILLGTLFVFVDIYILKRSLYRKSMVSA